MQNGNAYLGRLRGPWIESGGFLEFDFGGEKGSDEWPFGSAQGKPFEAQGKRVARKRFEERSRSVPTRRARDDRRRGRRKLETGKKKREFSLRRPTQSQERMRKKKIGLLPSK